MYTYKLCPNQIGCQWFVWAFINIDVNNKKYFCPTQFCFFDPALPGSLMRNMAQSSNLCDQWAGRGCKTKTQTLDLMFFMIIITLEIINYSADKQLVLKRHHNWGTIISACIAAKNMRMWQEWLQLQKKFQSWKLYIYWSITCTISSKWIFWTTDSDPLTVAELPTDWGHQYHCWGYI